MPCLLTTRSSHLETGMCFCCSLCRKYSARILSDFFVRPEYTHRGDFLQGQTLGGSDLFCKDLGVQSTSTSFSTPQCEDRSHQGFVSAGARELCWKQRYRVAIGVEGEVHPEFILIYGVETQRWTIFIRATHLHRYVPHQIFSCSKLNLLTGQENITRFTCTKWSSPAN